MSSKIIEKLETAQESATTFDLNNSCDNLYHICLQYYSTLTKLKHPKIKLITNILDALIEFKKTKNDNIKDYDIIHDMAYKNIQLIYDYDKEQKEKELPELPESDEDISGRVEDEITPATLSL
jgi:hypothetical protein